MTHVQIKRFSGSELHDYIDAVARLRIEVFREFPYLYDGSMDYERRYLQTYVQCPEAVVVLAFAGDTVVGASTGIPMRHEEAEFRQPFEEQGYDPGRVFYCAESVLLAPWRGQGIGGRFFDEREAHARQLGGFDWCCFCAVERPLDHPLRPASWQGHDAFWSKRGYARHPELGATYHWKDVDQAEQTSKRLVFWLKSVQF